MDMGASVSSAVSLSCPLVQMRGIVIFARFSGAGMAMVPGHAILHSIIYSNMQSFKIYSLLLVAGLLVAGCKKPAADAAQAAADTAASADAAAASAEVAIEVPAYSPEMASQSAQACERMSSYINEQIMTKEYELSRAEGDAKLAEQVAKLKEYQVLFSQMKDKVGTATADNWSGQYTEFQRLAIEAKAYLKDLAGQGQIIK
jgi:hypothetical protein